MRTHVEDNTKVWLAQVLISCNDVRSKESVEGLIQGRFRSINNTELLGLNYNLLKITPAQIELE